MQTVNRAKYETVNIEIACGLLLLLLSVSVKPRYKLKVW